MKNIYLILVILLLCACGNQTIRPDKLQYQGLEQASSYFQSRDYRRAALAYIQLFQMYHKDEFALKAADSWLQIQQYQQVREQLRLVKQINSPLFLLIQAQLSFNDGQYQQALMQLNRIQKNIDSELLPRYLRVKADIESANHNFLVAALTLIELSSIDSSSYNSSAIISNLLQTPEHQLTEALFNLDITELAQGWLEAALIAQSQDSVAILQWQSRWGEHPAEAFFLQAGNYKNIAVLLPMTGKYKNISNSIQQGMIAALYRDDSVQQQLNFFDTGSNGETFSYAWYGAIESGADFVIGPLEKKSIQQLVQFNSSTIPVMLLNQLNDESNPNGFYQFALSPDDEVRNVANRLIAENKKRIMLLAPESATGRRLARAFETELQFKGGKVVSYQFYPESAHDYSREIKQAVGLNDSIARTRKLQTVISHKLRSTPQIRPDIDAIFIVAKPKQARLIKPQLKFFQAEDIPVYATSQILSASIDTALDKDLDGIKFCQSAFVIDPTSLQDMLNFDVSKVKSNKKFFAFGYDAVALSSRLEWMQTMPNYKVASMSGNLSIDANGKLHRDLAWAQFKRGKPELLPPLVPQLLE